MVMATGIVAADLRLEGWRAASAALVAVAALVWAAAVAACVMRLVTVRAHIGEPAAATQRDDPQKPAATAAFGWYAVVAACVVLGSDLHTRGFPYLAAALAAAALVAWLITTWLVPARLASARLRRPRARPSPHGINATWYLWPVATQALAIAAAFAVADGDLPAGPGALLAIAAWSAGVLLYIATTMLVAFRLTVAGPGPAGTRPAYWVAMGAAAISVLAAAEILGLPRTPAIAAVGPAVTDISLALWYLASGLYLVLVVATALWWLRSGRPLRHHPATWVIIFPLGMYAAASWHLGDAAGVGFLHRVGTVAVWPAALAWALTAATLALSAATLAAPAARRLGRTALMRHPRLDANGAGGSRRYTFQAVVTVPAMADGAAASLLGPDWHGVIRAGTGAGRSGGLFSALVSSWEQHDGDPPGTGHSRAIATIVAFGPEPGDCLPAGEPFVLWRGQEVGHGVVTRRIFV
jgi:tellurite resistance protein TehA-like permease